eukprot:scaffold41791_cov29-Tisochrysis_lutea.AAC.5
MATNAEWAAAPAVAMRVLMLPSRRLAISWCRCVTKSRTGDVLTKKSPRLTVCGSSASAAAAMRNWSRTSEAISLTDRETAPRLATWADRSSWTTGMYGASRAMYASACGSALCSVARTFSRWRGTAPCEGLCLIALRIVLAHLSRRYSAALSMVRVCASINSSIVAGFEKCVCSKLRLRSSTHSARTRWDARRAPGVVRKVERWKPLRSKQRCGGTSEASP